MKIQRFNNSQNTNFQALRLPPLKECSPALINETAVFLRVNKRIGVKFPVEQTSKSSCDFVCHIMTEFGSLMENDLFARLVRHDVRVTRVENNSVTSLADSLLHKPHSEFPRVDEKHDLF